MLDVDKSIKVDGLEKSIIDKCKQRIIAVAVIFFVSFIIVNIKLIDTSKPLKAKEKIVRDIKKANKRGDILDRNGALLAISMPSWSLYKNKDIVYDLDKAKENILKIIPSINEGNLEIWLKSKKNFQYIARHLTPEIAKEVNKLGQPALKFQMEYLRVYPLKEEFSHIVGYTGIDKNGLAGIELKYNNVLNAGKNIFLTLDSRIQYKIFNILQNGIPIYKYKGAVGIVIDINTGEVLSGISIPSFNPNVYHSINITPNQITGSNFELGSVFKAITIASALNEKIINMKSQFDASEPIKIGKYYIKDFHPEERTLGLEEVFIHSSNIGSALIALKLGKDKQSDYFKKLGLNDIIESGIPEVQYPTFPSRNKTSDIHVATMSYGHGIAVSPLNITSALATTVNGGEYIKPTVVIDPKLLSRPRIKVFDKDVSNIMKKLYKSNVDIGTAKKMKSMTYLVGAKTGTANKNDGRKYKKNKVVSSLITFFPINNPKYALFVLLDEPKATGSVLGRTPGFNAVPLSINIINEIAPILGIKSNINAEL